MSTEGAEAIRMRIDAQLRALHLPGALARYRELAQEIGTDDKALHLLDGVLAAELASREQHRYDRNLRAARFPVVKELAGFDFSAIPSVPWSRIQELATGRFIAAHETVLLVGNPGTGKAP